MDKETALRNSHTNRKHIKEEERENIGRCRSLFFFFLLYRRLSKARLLMNAVVISVTVIVVTIISHSVNFKSSVKQ